MYFFYFLKEKRKKTFSERFVSYVTVKTLSTTTSDKVENMQKVLGCRLDVCASLRRHNAVF